MKDLPYSQVKRFKEKLNKFSNDLIKKNKLQKDFDDYYKKHKMKAVKDVKYLSDDFVYEDIRCLFRETNDISSVKWGLLTRPRSGFFKFLTTLKLLKNH